MTQPKTPQRTAAQKKADASKARLEKRGSKTKCGEPRKLDGKRCDKVAGWGTNHPGEGPCKHHGGTVPKARHTQRDNIVELNGMARPRKSTPGESLEAVLNLAVGQLIYCTHKVGELEESKMFNPTYTAEGAFAGMIPNHWIRLQREVMHDVAKFAKMGADAGIAERGQVIAEAQTAMMAQVLEAVVSELDLTPSQQKQLGPAIRETLENVDRIAHDQEAA